MGVTSVDLETQLDEKVLSSVLDLFLRVLYADITNRLLQRFK